MDLTLRNDKLIQKRFDVLKAEAYKKYADDPEKAKHVAGTLSTTALVISGIWAEFYEVFKYDSPWIMTTMDEVSPFIKSFSNKRLNAVALEDLPNDVITVFVIPENNRIELIIGTTSVAVIKVDDTNIHVSFTKENEFELSDFVKEHIKAALVKIDNLTRLTDETINKLLNKEEDESDV